MRKTIKRIVNFNYQNYWNVHYNSDYKYICFENYADTKNIIFETVFISFKKLLKELKSYIDNFDVSYETYIWLDKFGHGTNGSPYEMEDVLNNTKEELSMYKTLFEDLQNLYTLTLKGDN